MKIVNVVCAPGRTGFFFDDQKAIKSGAVSDGAAYVGETMTPGFKSIRQAGESISVMLVLEDGQIAWGDCAAVQYSGAGGRDPLFLAEDFIPVIDKYIKPALVGKEADNFRELTKMMEAIEVDGKRLHTAIRYGVSQAILDAVAKATKRLMSEVVADEYGTTVSEEPIPIFTQSGDNRYENADKMILKGAAILPHALINNVETKLGRDGSKLKEYVCWLRDRILHLRNDESYAPVFHIDVYGTIGQAFGDDNFKAMADYLAELEEAGKLKAVITQNIDNLHQMAGSKHVLELHGSVYRNYCMKCGKFYNLQDTISQEGVPKCSCGGIIKPDVVLYEEGLDSYVLEKAVNYIKNADILIIGGTSLAVYPAAGLIDYYRGNKLVLINKSETSRDAHANLVINDAIGKVFSQLL